MQCNTSKDVCQSQGQPVEASETLTGWQELLKGLPSDLDLEKMARTSGALLRRRVVQSAADLLRLIMLYAVNDYSLRLVAEWSAVSGLGLLSKTAVRQRLRHSVGWLGTLVAALLREPLGDAADRAGCVCLRLVDATVISHPGSQGTDWRVHLSLDLGQDRLAGIEVTDAHGGETLARFPTQREEIRVGDRGYAHASGLGPVLEAQGRVVVRTNWQNLPLENELGQRWDVAAWLQDAFSPDVSEPQEQGLWLPTKQGRFAVRLVAYPLPPEQAEAARRRARYAAHKKKHTIDKRTLLAAGFILVLTNLPAESWSGAQVLRLYRLRWQIELRIKRLKSVLALDALRAQDPELVQAYLLAKLLGALLVDRLQQQVRKLQPDWWSDTRRPINRWQLAILAWDTLTAAIRGPLAWTQFLGKLPDLRRNLCDQPRARPLQWQEAEWFLHGVSSC